MAKTKDKVEEVKEKKAEEKVTQAKEAENTEKKAKKQTLRIEEREDVKTFFFPPEAFKLTKINNKFGYAVSGYEKNGYDIQIFIPQKDKEIESKQLKYSKKMPNWIVATMPKDTKLTGYIMVDVERKKEEKDERLLDEYEVHDTKAYDKIDNRKVDRYTNKKIFFEGRPERENDDEYVEELYNEMYGKKQRREEYCTIGTTVLEKLEKKYSNYRNKNEEKGKEEPVKDAEVKETEKVDKENKEVIQDATNDAGKTDNATNKAEKPIWIRTIDKKEEKATGITSPIKTLQGGKGYFLSGFEQNDETLSIFIPRKEDGISSQQKKNWIMITAESDYKFQLYRPDGKGDFEPTGYHVKHDVVRRRAWKFNQDVEKALGKDSQKTNDNSLSR